MIPNVDRHSLPGGWPESLLRVRNAAMVENPVLTQHTCHTCTHTLNALCIHVHVRVHLVQQIVSALP